MVNELIQQWLVAHSNSVNIGEWKVTWQFNAFSKYEPYVDIFFWLFSACVVVVNLILAGYRLGNDK